MKILVTGGAGFIGSALIRYLIRETNDSVFNIDKLTYAGNLNSLAEVIDSNRYAFAREDICNTRILTEFFKIYQPDVVMHLAAESHVDRSIISAASFIQTNIVGTYSLLEVARNYWQTLPFLRKESFRFHYISTDEVYGDLENSADFFRETSVYAPSSPYSASKASADHLVRAWHRTYGLPVLLTHCSNNYGPYQLPEKFIPLIILNALAAKPLPIYGNGKQIRDWLYVEDHVRALYLVATRGRPGETYNIGANNEQRNIDVVQAVCRLLEELTPKPARLRHFIDLITHVKDRLGHDQRYAVDASKLQSSLGWRPQETFTSGLRKTVEWYLANLRWVTGIKEGGHQNLSAFKNSECTL